MERFYCRPTSLTLLPVLIFILALNVLIYAAMAASTGQFSWSARQLLHWGADLGELSLHGQPWRLLTAMFLHASPMHIFGNMTLLAVTGPYVERKIGAIPVLIAYLLCGLVASLFSAIGHPAIVGVGASGAIAGLLGIMVAFYMSGHAPEVSGAWIAQTVGFNAVLSLTAGVDWLAHLGGFGTGITVGVLLPFLLPRLARG